MNSPTVSNAAGFGVFNLDPALLNALRKAGYDEPRPIQTEAIPSVIAGRDVLGLAQTGTGKTAAFGLPLLQCLLEKTGFRVRVTEIHGRPKSESAPLFISVVAERQVSKGATLKNTKHKENVFRVRARRRLGIIRALPPSQKVRGLLSTVKHMFTPLN